MADLDDKFSASAPGEEKDQDYSLPLSADGKEPWIPQSPYPGGRSTPPPPPKPGFSPAGWKEAGLVLLMLALIGLAIAFLPGLGTIASLFMPLVSARLYLRRGPALALLATGGALLLDGILLGFSVAAGIFLQYALMGLLLGFCFRRESKPARTLFATAACCLLGQVLSLLLSFWAEGISLSEFWPALEESYVATLETIASVGSMSGVSLNQFLDYGLELLNRLFLGMMAMSALATGALCYWFSSSILRRQGYSIPKLPKFKLWRVDWRVSWGLILGLLCTVLGANFELPLLEKIGPIFSMVFGPVLALCGLSALLWLMEHSRLPGILKVLVFVILLLFFNVMIYVLMLLAVLDGMKDLRAGLLARQARKKD